MSSKKINQYIFPVLILTLFFFTACPNPFEGSIVISPESVQISIGESVTLTVEAVLSESSLPEVVWFSADTGIAKISSRGELTGISQGQVTIRCSLVENPDIKAFCEVTVIDPSEELIRDQNTDVTVGEGIYWYFFTAATASEYEIQWRNTGGNALVSAYHGNRTTPFFENDQSGLKSIETAGSERIYLKVESRDSESFSIKYNINNQNDPETWTLLIYLDCYDAEDAITDNVKDMLAGYHSHTGINVIIFIDKESSNAYSIPGLGFDGAGLFLLNEDGLHRMSGGNDFPDISYFENSEINAGDAEVLKKFINFGKGNFPAARYGVILMGHGAAAGGLFNDENIDDKLHPGEISAVLGADQSVQLLGLNSCLMGNVETAYQFRNDVSNTGFKADYLLAPPSNTRDIGWAYAQTFARLDTLKGGSTNGEPESMTGGTESIYSPGSITAEELGLVFIEEHRDYMYNYSKLYGDGDSLVLYDMTKVKTVKERFDDLVLSIRDQKTAIETLRDDPDRMIRYFRIIDTPEIVAYNKTKIPYYDLKGFCEGIHDDLNFSSDARSKADLVMDAINDFIEYSYFGSYISQSDPYGLSFFFPTGDGVYLSKQMFTYQWWYNPNRVDHIPSEEKFYGNLDWCKDKATDIADEADNWFELLDYWYDPDGNGVDGGVNFYQY